MWSNWVTHGSVEDGAHIEKDGSLGKNLEKVSYSDPFLFVPLCFSCHHKVVFCFLFLKLLSSMLPCLTTGPETTELGDHRQKPPEPWAKIAFASSGLSAISPGAEKIGKQEKGKRQWSHQIRGDLGVFPRFIPVVQDLSKWSVVHGHQNTYCC